MTEREIIVALRELNLSQEVIGAAIGRDRSSASRLLNGVRQMKVGEMALLEKLIAQHRSPAPAPAIDRPFSIADVRTWTKDVPVFGTALGGDLVLDEVTQTMHVEQTILELTGSIDVVRRPPTLAGNTALYAVYVAGSSMEPRYDPGELLYVDPRRPPANGDDVIVQLRDGEGHDGEDRVISALVKRLVRRNAGTIELEQYNPPLRFKVSVKHIAAVHRVVRFGEVIGM